MLVWHVWDMYDEVDRLHVKRNGIVGMNYLGIIDVNAFAFIYSHISLDFYLDIC